MLVFIHTTFHLNRTLVKEFQPSELISVRGEQVMFEGIFLLFWLCALLRQWMCYKYCQHFKMWLGNTFVMYHDHKNYRNMSRFITIMRSKSKRQPFFILCILRVLLACTRTEDGKQVTSGDILPSVTLVTLLQTSRSSEAHGTCHTVVC